MSGETDAGQPCASHGSGLAAQAAPAGTHEAPVAHVMRGELPDIHSLVPHSGSMLLLDRLIAVDAESACAEVTVTREAMFASEQGVGSWVGIEYMAQTIAAFAGFQAQQQARPVRIGFLLGSRRYEALCGHFALGSVLRIQALRALQGDNGLGAFECTIREGDKLLAKATITVFQPPNVDEFLQEIGSI